MPQISGPILPAPQPPQILIVDDQPDIQLLTRMSLKRLRHHQLQPVIEVASSGAEAVAWLKAHPQTQVVIMDIIMETNRAGLDAIEAIRAFNQEVQIIVHTAQAAEFSDLDVVQHYAVDGYCQKGFSGQNQLYTAVLLALRHYDQLQQLKAERHYWQELAEASLADAVPQAC